MAEHWDFRALFTRSGAIRMGQITCSIVSLSILVQDGWMGEENTTTSNPVVIFCLNLIGMITSLFLLCMLAPLDSAKGRSEECMSSIQLAADVCLASTLFVWTFFWGVDGWGQHAACVRFNTKCTKLATRAQISAAFCGVGCILHVLGAVRQIKEFKRRHDIEEARLPPAPKINWSW